MLTSKLSSRFEARILWYTVLAREADKPTLDLLDRELMDWAKRAVLPALPGGLIVAIVFEDLNVAGVEVRGFEASDRSMDSEAVEP